MANADSPERRRHVIQQLLVAVGTRDGWFPPALRFRADNEEDIPAIEALTNIQELRSFGDRLAWSIETLRLARDTDSFADEELQRIALVFKDAKAHYKTHLTQPLELAPMLERIRKVSPFVTEVQVQRAVVALQSIIRMTITAHAETQRPMKVALSEDIFKIDSTAFERAVAPPAPLAPPQPKIPDDAIDGRWVPSTKKAPRKGGNGEVIAVTDFTTEYRMPLALKRLQKSMISEKALARFKKEILVLQSIDHPNVLRLLAASLDGDVIYYVSKYHPHDLSEHMGTSALSPAETLNLFAEICDGVSEVHKKGIVHRDLKPSNVLIDTKGRAVVADFGICFAPGDERHTGTQEQMGPRKYMAPELADGRAEDEQITIRADVYSLGKLLYFMLAPRGALIFDREDHHESRFEIANVTGREELAHVNRLFDVTIQRDPAARLANAGELAARVRAMIPIVSGNYRTIAPTGGQRCQFCGEGRYALVAPGAIGLTITAGGNDIRVLRCSECGSAQIFKVDGARKAAEWGRPPGG